MKLLLLASPYGSGDYSHGIYEGHNGFFDKYAWLIFLLMFLVAVTLFVLIVRRSRKNQQIIKLDNPKKPKK